MPASTTSLPHQLRQPLRLAFIAGGAVALVLVIAWLLWPTPAGPAVLRGGTAHYIVTATVASPQLDATTVDIDLADRTGRPAPPATVDVEAVMPTMGHAAAPVRAVRTADGRYRAAGLPLTMGGPWVIHLTIDGPEGSERLALPLG